MDNIYPLFLECTGICTDTRQITKDCFFVCLTGENFDGNKFAEQALEAGAKYVVIDNADYEHLPNTVLVENSLKALQELARHHRRQFDIPVLGITGSNGKTTSKELISCVLKTEKKVHYTKGNLNNHIGVPLTLLGLKKEHEIAVVEMGANHFGDIAELCAIAEPNHGIITNIGKAHLEGFGDFKGVLKTKKELYDFVESVDGHLFYNIDDEVLKGIVPNVSTSTYGKENAEVKGKLVRLNPFTEFEWSTSSYASSTLSTNLVGEYNFYNFLAAICIGKYFGISDASINSAIEGYKPSNNRSQVSKTERNTLIVDCYNANPTSMASALESFVAIEHNNKIAVLGDMRELGKDAALEHQKILDFNRSKSIKTIYVGEEFGKLVGETENKFPTTKELIASGLLQNIENGLVLLKGSRGIQLEKVIVEL